MKTLETIIFISYNDFSGVGLDPDSKIQIPWIAKEQNSTRIGLLLDGQKYTFFNSDEAVGRMAIQILTQKLAKKDIQFNTDVLAIRNFNTYAFGESCDCDTCVETKKLIPEDILQLEKELYYD